ncbi:MAG: hypothetical protein HeimC2_27450 [Candidatus Heimdallarchaeota archaeon LC_2]|nr:MAG: hypothetical protein HeimC2_27450 [Candidatus Heimdallarchaeota archaeon LC_2]
MTWKRSNPEARLKPLLDILPLSIKSELWLDIGTGDGFFSNLMKNLHPKTIIVRSDISNRANYSDLGLKSYIEKLGIRPRSLSGIICSQVLHYQNTNYQNKILDILNTFLGIEGLLIIIEYEINHSYSWIPYPISQKYLINYGRTSNIWNYYNSKRISDGHRTKFAVLLKKLSPKS